MDIKDAIFGFCKANPTVKSKTKAKVNNDNKKVNNQLKPK